MTAAVASSSAGPAEKAKVDAFEVGWLFVQEYYTFLNRDQQRLHCFYNKKSSFLHGHEGEATAKTYHGQQEIHSRIVDLDFQDCKVLVSNVDSQGSLNGGIVVQVLGEMSNNGGASHKFAQTFFLAEQPNGYYVLNDIFRFLKEDIDNEYEEAEDPTGGLDLMDNYAPEEPVHPSSHEVPSAEPEQKTVTPRKTGAKARAPSPAKEELHPTPEIDAGPIESAAPVSDAPAPADDWVGEGHTPEEETSRNPDQGTASSAAPLADEQKVSTAAEAEITENGVGKQSAPKATAAAVQAQKQKTWASLAATNLAAKQPAVAVPASQAQAKPAPTTTTNTTPSATATNQRPASPPKPAVKTVEKREEESVSSEDSSHIDQKDGGFREVHNRQQKRAPQGAYQQQPPMQQQTPAEDDREKFSIYLRGINDAIDRKSLHETFSKVGIVKNIDLVSTKNIAFVEFTTMEAAQQAIGNTFSVNGQTVHAEERRKPRFVGNNNVPRGAYAARGGSFHDSGMRTRGDGFRGPAARGRGGYNGPQKPVPAAKPAPATKQS
ncbi:hypothetical protein PhCBS80983_g04877 [Powellomyces hirtus]|uniref:NTF2 domain-containing protein n=1 Tax=Powellomyces hirtus TaxID=109895 RepID=A0A507DX15_9FUNG|nr:hypothetical protein PhCBS80983_g04877 [Powellomyces hirtus]